MVQTRLSLRYSGPAVDAGLMDVYDAAANMIAFSEFVVSAAKTVYGDTSNAKAEVAGFGHGSFVTDIVISVGGPLASLFTSGSAKELIEVVGETVKLWKHLEGEPPKEVQPAASNEMTVTNNNGQQMTFQAQTINVVFGDKPSEAVSKFIRSAMERDGMDRVSIESDEGGKAKPIAEITRDESGWFMPVAPETPLFDNVIKSALVIEAPVFKDGNKWRFSDGSGSFYADIADEAFIAKVDSGEAFAKGDSLIVDMRIRQCRQGERLLTEKTILKVHEHRRRQLQAGLL